MKFEQLVRGKALQNLIILGPAQVQVMFQIPQQTLEDIEACEYDACEHANQKATK